MMGDSIIGTCAPALVGEGVRPVRFTLLSASPALPHCSTCNCVGAKTICDP